MTISLSVSIMLTSPSLRLLVEPITADDDQVEICTKFLKKHPGPSIIYVTTHAVGLYSPLNGNLLTLMQIGCRNSSQ